MSMRNWISEFIAWVIWHVRYRMGNFGIRWRDSFFEWQENRQSRREHRQQLKYDSSKSLKERFYDWTFYLLDYDPTHHESGESHVSVTRAAYVWFHRVVLTRWIEITGVVLVVLVGAICYLSILASKS